MVHKYKPFEIGWESKVEISKIDFYADTGIGKKEHLKSVRERIEEKFGDDVKIKFLKTREI